MTEKQLILSLFMSSLRSSGCQKGRAGKEREKLTARPNCLYKKVGKCTLPMPEPKIMGLQKMYIRKTCARNIYAVS
jgi:hypothetical protein